MESSNTIVRDTAILVIITLVVGILLGAVNMVTKEPIAAAEQKATNEAYAVVMEGADFGDSMTIDDKVKTKYTNAKLLDCRAATKDGQAAGWVVKLNATKGYGGDVCIVIGFDTDATITGFTVLSADNETPGLGANCTKEDFTSQFAGKNAGDGDYTLYKASDKSADTDMSAGIDAITSATITSTAVTDAVNAANKFVHEYCMNGGSSEVSADE